MQSTTFGSPPRLSRFPGPGVPNATPQVRGSAEPATPELASRLKPWLSSFCQAGLVAVLDAQSGPQRVVLPMSVALVQRAQFVEQDPHGPAVEDDVQQWVNQAATCSCSPSYKQLPANDRPLSQLEWVACFFCPDALELCFLTWICAKIVSLQSQPLSSLHLLHGLPIHHPKPGAQAFVPPDDAVPRPWISAARFSWPLRRTPPAMWYALLAA